MLGGSSAATRPISWLLNTATGPITRLLPATGSHLRTNLPGTRSPNRWWIGTLVTFAPSRITASRGLFHSAQPSQRAGRSSASMRASSRLRVCTPSSLRVVGRRAGTPTSACPNVINPWSLDRLRDRWLEGIELIYIGCAGATASSRNLSKRLRDLLRHGAGLISTTGPHKGGERLWQCVGWESFELAWMPTDPYPEPHECEVAIGERFLELTGALPFANVRL